MKIRIKIATYVLLGLFFTACQKGEIETPNGMSDRTVLVYMAANNSLSSWAQPNIQGMIRGMSGIVKGNLIVYLDLPNAEPQLLKVTEQGQTVIKTYSKENSASSEVLGRVLREVRELFPAQSYGLILWSHGLGWVPKEFNLTYASSYATPETIPGFLMTKWFAEDKSFDSRMNIDELASALPTDRSLEFIIFDACLMSGVETLYELRNAARYIIGSPAEILAEGFPYSSMVHYLFTEPFSPANVGEVFMNFYTNYKDPYAAISVVKTSEMEALAATIRRIMEIEPAPVLPSLAGVLRFDKLYSPVFFDLNDYLLQLLGGDNDLYISFKEQLARTVVYKATTKKVYGNVGSPGQIVVPQEVYSGITAFVPNTNTSLNAAFRATSWAIATGQSTE